jgi:DNA-binding CsgD family transcriptional regulator
MHNRHNTPKEMLEKRKAKLKILSDNMQPYNEELVKSKSELESLNRELLQTHQAMSVLAKNIDSKKMELEKKVNTTITSKVMPIIKELLTEKRAKRFWPEISSMAEHLNSITTKSELHLKSISVLTETEMKIAAMVKNKMTSKEIGTLMYISLETVKAHRKNIRKKLEIHNTKFKLSDYLATVMGE